jgi:hypothetical protein
MNMPDIRDIKDVVGVFDFGTFLFLLLCAAALAAAGYFVYLKYLEFKQRVKPLKTEPVIARPFNEIALERIERLDPVWYREKGEIKEYYIELTEALREFLSKNYLVDTLDKTSYEIVLELERVERDYQKVKALDRYFSDCDLVKFARHDATLAEMRGAKDDSIKIVKEYYRHAFR